MLLKDLIDRLNIIYKHLSEEDKRSETVELGYDEMYVPKIPFTELSEDEKKKLALDEEGSEEYYEEEEDVFAIFI